MEDQISRLTDDLLVRILSFLPTKYAVGTTILSKRWNYLWTFVPNLDFDDQLVLNPQDIRRKSINFMNFVDRVLCRNVDNAAPHIQKLGFQCLRPTYMSRFTQWISFAVERGVQELNITSNEQRLLKLPLSLFTCETLVVLIFDNGLSLDIPASVYLPSLKVLVMNVFNPNNALTQNLLSGCPVLEELNIVGDIVNTGVTFNIIVPTLKRLHLRFIAEKIEKYYDCWVVIDTPSLEYFCLHDDILVCYFVKDLPSLIEAKIDVGMYGDWFNEDFEIQRNADSVKDLLRRISGVDHLVLSNRTFNVLAMLFSLCHDELLFLSPLKGLNSVGDDNLPTFCYLSHLDLVDVNNHLVPNVLKSFPSLEVLKLKTDPVLDYGQFSYSPPRDVPSCLLSRLKEVYFCEFGGWNDELKTINYLLKNAAVLDSMTIQFNCFTSGKRMSKTRSKVLSFPVSSKTCHIEFLP